jgi:DNA-directed RNA polymerase specialized sigma24 family protein
VPDISFVDDQIDGGGVTVEQRRGREFDALFEAYRLDVASYCCWRAGSMPDAEDAMAEVFLVAWRRLEDVPVGDAARAWLYATARRVLADQRRSGRRREALRRCVTAEPIATRPNAAETSAEQVAVYGYRSQEAKSGLAPRTDVLRSFGSSQSSWRPSAVRSRK